MNRKIRLSAALAGLAFAAATAQPSLAQEDPATVGQDTTKPASEEINNGTNPTLLANTADLNGKYTDLGNGLSLWTIKPTVTVPFGKKNVSLSLAVPLTQTPFDNTFNIGDISAKFTHVVAVNRKRGIAYTVEVYMDTASGTGRGYGEPVIEMSGFYAMFMKNGAILAPALVHTFGVGNPKPVDGANDSASELLFTPANGTVGIASASPSKSLSTSTFDFYIVPKLKNPKLFVTFDPALVHDWRSDDTFGSLTVTFGSSVGKLGKGNLAIYAKPQVLMGSQRPADWSVAAGMKVIGF